MAKRLAFFGPAGTFTEEAAIAYDAAASRLPYPSIAAVASAVEGGLADEGVVPIENSLEGSVTHTLDLLIHDSNLFIRHELVLPIHHSLLAKPGTKMEEIAVVYSHPQALAQCRGFLGERYPHAQMVASWSTAAAVEQLKEGDKAAAVANLRAAELYGAVVLAHPIEDSPNNVTRFTVLATSDHPPTGADKTSICFSFDQDAPGLLYGVMGCFARLGINLAKVESRPTRQSLGRYIFLIDADGHREDPLLKEALEQVRSRVSMLKVFGSYPRASVPEE